MALLSDGADFPLSKTLHSNGTKAFISLKIMAPYGATPAQAFYNNKHINALKRYDL
jgi:hypothetical protein